MHARLRELKNELGMINVQLDEQENTPEQLRIYRLEHSQAGHMADTLLRVIRQANITPDDHSNSLIVNATPDKHEQIERLLRELDTTQTATARTQAARAPRASGASGATQPATGWTQTANSATRESRASDPVSTGTAPPRVAKTARSATQASRAAGTGPSRQDRGVLSQSMNTGGAADQNLNAEVNELRGQVRGLNNQMQEMRALLEQLIQQKKSEQP
jgi:ribosomal protein L12E/L44/L45/RPP1/RPP2